MRVRFDRLRVFVQPAQQGTALYNLKLGLAAALDDDRSTVGEDDSDVELGTRAQL
jgi:hypothetical protein